MNTRLYFGIASFAVVIAGGLIALLLVPSDSWKPVSAFSYFVFIMLTGFSLYSFIESPRGKKGGDAAFIGIFSASGIAVLVTWFLSVLTMFLSFHVPPAWAWSFNILTITSFIVQMAILYAGAEIIDESAAKAAELSNAGKWLKDLSVVKDLLKNAEHQKLIQDLYDQIYYGSSGIHGKNTSADSKISTYIERISTEIQLGEDQIDTIDSRVDNLKKLISVRENELRSLRTKAF